MDGVLPGHMNGVLPGHMDGVLPRHMDGVLPGHMDGVLPGHRWGLPGHMDGVLPGHLNGHWMGVHEENAPMCGQNSSKLEKSHDCKTPSRCPAPIHVPGQNPISRSVAG